MRKRRSRPGVGRRARAAAALAAIFAVGACSPPAPFDQGIRSGALVSCATTADPMYFTARPTLSTSAQAGKGAPTSVRFEVDRGRPGEVDERVWGLNGIERTATGVVVPVAVVGGRYAATWTVPVDLETPSQVDPSVHVPGEFSWRSRSEPAGRPPARWSRWHPFDISLVIPPVEDCRVTADDVFYAWAYGRGRLTAGLLDEYAHARRLREAFGELRRRYPTDFTAAGDGHSSNRPDDGDGSGEWIVFRGPVPAGAVQLLAQVRARPFGEGGGSLEVLDRRGYNAAEEDTRLRLAEGAIKTSAVETSGRAFLHWAGIDSRTGVLHLEVSRSGHNRHQDEELRRQILQAIATGTKLHVVPAEKDSRADATTLPVESRLGGPDDFGHG